MADSISFGSFWVQNVNYKVLTEFNYSLLDIKGFLINWTND